MSHAHDEECVVHVPGDRVSDTDLLALRPAPRRDPELVARRAAAIRSARSINPWPILISLAGPAGYLAAAAVIR